MIRRLLLVLALGSALGAGVVAEPADAAAPTVGSCHQLTLAAAAAPTDPTPAVPCTRNHDTQTVGVVQSPMPLAGMSAQDFSVIADQLCHPLWMKAFGRPALVRDQTVYSELFFRPTDVEVAAGANWVRCDIDMHAATSLLPLPRHRLTSPVVPRQITTQIRRCLVGTQHLTTPCSRAHTYRSVSAFTVPQTTPLPDAALIAAAERHCPANWKWATWTLAPFRSLDKTVVCYIKTRH